MARSVLGVRLRRGAVVALATGAVAMTTMLAGLVTNAVSDQARWPGLLGWFQSHAWLSFVLLGALTVLLSVLLTALTSTSTTPLPADGATGEGTGLPSAALVLRALPRDATAFTDRATQLESLLRSVRAAQERGEPLPVHVVDGMPGVGKTTFAVHAGHALSDSFPDGQLFVNLRGHARDHGPVQATEALASLLAASGVPAQQIPVGDDPGAVTEARAAMWRSRLAGKKALLILDNAASYGQLEPLLPGGGGCLVLVTSRRRLAADEEVVLPVEALRPDHAADLFVRLSGRPADTLDRAALAELVGLCGCLPLGVSLLAARLRHHPSWRVEDLRDRLAAARDRLGELRAGERAVTATFDLSYRDLPSDQQRFFRCVGLHPGIVLDAYTSAAAGDLPVSRARRHLDALYDNHLIDEQPSDRYQLHDLVRDYARALADVEGDSMDDPDTDDPRGARAGHGPASPREQDVVRRLCHYYLAALATANRHIARAEQERTAQPDEAPGDEALPAHSTPPMESLPAALEWLEGERPNILACVGRAGSLGLHTCVIRLAAAMAPFLRQAGPWDQAVDVHRTAADAARQRGDLRAGAAALTELGVIQRFMSAYPEACEALDEAAARFEAAGDQRGRADALNQAGIVHYLTADNEAAANAQTEALALYRETGDRLGQANALTDLAMIRRQTSRFAASMQAQTAALEIFRALRDRYGEANSLRNLGAVRCLMGEYATASRLQQEAFDIFRELGDRVHQAYVLNERGVTRRLTGDIEGARRDHTRALEHYGELGERFGQANSARWLGVLERVGGRAGEAARLSQQALETYRELGSRGGEAAALGDLGVVRRLAGDPAGAADAFVRSVDILRELGDRCGEAEVLNHWGTLLLDTGDPVAGRARHEAALALARDAGCPLEEARALEGAGRCALRGSGTRAAADEPLRAALAVYRRLGARTEAAGVENLLA